MSTTASPADEPELVDFPRNPAEVGLAVLDCAFTAGQGSVQKGNVWHGANMISTRMRRWSCGVALWAPLIILGVAPGLGRGEERLREDLVSINNEWTPAIFAVAGARRAAKTDEAREQVENEFEKKQRQFVDGCLEIARSEPDSYNALVALKLVACRAPKTPEGEQAAATLILLAKSADLDLLAESLPFSANVSEKPIFAIAPIILARVKQQPDHPQAARLLASVVCGLTDRDALEASPEFTAAADLIVERYANSPEIVHFCELMAPGGTSSAWTVAFEKHLRTILEKNQHRSVRAAGSYALASVVAASGGSCQEEAVRLFEEFIQQFDGETSFDGNEFYTYITIEKFYRERAVEQLAALRLIGQSAPEIDGVDLDGQVMKLSEYRGKVVLLNFWGTWCRPCMAMIPEEIEIAKHFQGKPFAIVGVDDDPDPREAKAVADRLGVTWRSFRQGPGQQVIDAWRVHGWPTFYLIDAEGIVRCRWVDDQPRETLIRAIEALIDHAPETSATE
jgi:thiol-disulfide isomerase/thioredoxin